MPFSYFEKKIFSMMTEYRLAFLEDFADGFTFMLVLGGSSLTTITSELAFLGQPVILLGPGQRRMTTSSRSCSLVAGAKQVRKRSIPTTSYPTEFARSA